MSIPPLQSVLSAIDAAFVDLILAFLEQVLHVPTPVRDSIKHMEITETYESVMHGRFTHQEWAVLVVLTSPLSSSIGDRILLAVDNRSGTYTISRMYFELGWKPQEEQAE